MKDNARLTKFSSDRLAALEAKAAVNAHAHSVRLLVQSRTRAAENLDLGLGRRTNDRHFRVADKRPTLNPKASIMKPSHQEEISFVWLIATIRTVTV